ncbi:MAG: sigma-E factor negative regulatory protein, partial [Burkholderiaceae bacterium]
MGEHRNEDPSRARLSAIMDGQADPADVQRWLQHEASQAAVQEDWHTYHLIGDALRSGDLASSPARDRRLLRKVQQALSEEPVVLAPGAAASTGAVQRPIRRRLWAAAAAGVAGFAVVAGAFFTTRAEWGDLPVIAWAPSGGPSSEDFRRASVGSPGPDGSPALTGSTQAPFREILRLPRGPAQRPL